MEKLDIPPVSEFMSLITAGGRRIDACKLAMDMFKFKKEDLCEYVSEYLLSESSMNWQLVRIHI